VAGASTSEFEDDGLSNLLPEPVSVPAEDSVLIEIAVLLVCAIIVASYVWQANIAPRRTHVQFLDASLTDHEILSLWHQVSVLSRAERRRGKPDRPRVTPLLRSGRILQGGRPLKRRNWAGSLQCSTSGGFTIECRAA